MSKSSVNIDTYNQDYLDCKGCSKGIGYCKRPCWPLPLEASLLIEAGYGDRLMLDFWGRAPEQGGNILILCPANPGYESKFAEGGELSMLEDPEELEKMGKEKATEIMIQFAMSALLGSGGLETGLNSGCNFQSSDGLCQLHDKGLKPFEGKRTCCKTDGLGIHEAVAMQWDNKEAQELAKNWKSKFLKNN